MLFQLSICGVCIFYVICILYNINKGRKTSMLTYFDFNLFCSSVERNSIPTCRPVPSFAEQGKICHDLSLIA